MNKINWSRSRSLITLDWSMTAFFAKPQVGHLPPRLPRRILLSRNFMNSRLLRPTSWRLCKSREKAASSKKEVPRKALLSKYTKASRSSWWLRSGWGNNRSQGLPISILVQRIVHFRYLIAKLLFCKLTKHFLLSIPNRHLCCQTLKPNLHLNPVIPKLPIASSQYLAICRPQQ